MCFISKCSRYSFKVLLEKNKTGLKTTKIYYFKVLFGFSYCKFSPEYKFVSNSISEKSELRAL